MGSQRPLVCFALLHRVVTVRCCLGTPPPFDNGARPILALKVGRSKDTLLPMRTLHGRLIRGAASFLPSTHEACALCVFRTDQLLSCNSILAVTIGVPVRRATIAAGCIGGKKRTNSSKQSQAQSVNLVAHLCSCCCLSHCLIHCSENSLAKCLPSVPTRGRLLEQSAALRRHSSAYILLLPTSSPSPNLL